MLMFNESFRKQRFQEKTEKDKIKFINYDPVRDTSVFFSGRSVILLCLYVVFFVKIWYFIFSLISFLGSTSAFKIQAKRSIFNHYLRYS